MSCLNYQTCTNAPWMRYGKEATYTLDAEELDALKAVEKARLDSLQAARSEFEKRTGYTREEK